MSATGNSLCFWAHHKLVKGYVFTLGVMSGHSFEEVAWREVYNALYNVPQLFKLWSCKQVMGEAVAILNQSQYIKYHDPHCQSCTKVLETCGHVLMCEEAGRVDALARSIGWLDSWLKKLGAAPSLRKAIVMYARGRDSHSMEDITFG